MKSPITGEQMTLEKEKRSIDFRKEKFSIMYHYYKCHKSGEQFTTTSLDEVNTNQVYNQYREKSKLPFPDQISAVREKFGLSAAKMSTILGFGANSYRQYEAGEMPSISNARLIQMIEDPQKFIEMVELCGLLDTKTKGKYIQRAQRLIEHNNQVVFNLQAYLLGSRTANIYSGYRSPNFKKLTEMIVYFSEQVQPFKTKMNKLLFYADFLMFNKSCFSISGVRYHAIEMGPVPQNFQSIFELLVNEGEIEVHYKNFPKGYAGEQFGAIANRKFNPELFSQIELDVLKGVSIRFKETSTNDIIEQSHLEEAWKQNVHNKGAISYDYAFNLTQLL